MLTVGLQDDVLDLIAEDPPLPDRYYAYEGLLTWLADHPGLSYLPALLDTAASLLLVVAGVALLVGAGRRTGLRAGAFICALGVLDEVDLPGIAVPAELTGLYFTLYWPVLLAAFVRLPPPSHAPSHRERQRGAAPRAIRTSFGPGFGP